MINIDRKTSGHICSSSIHLYFSFLPSLCRSPLLQPLPRPSLPVRPRALWLPPDRRPRRGSCPPFSQPHTHRHKPSLKQLPQPHSCLLHRAAGPPRPCPEEAVCPHPLRHPWSRPPQHPRPRPSSQPRRCGCSARPPWRRFTVALVRRRGQRYPLWCSGGAAGGAGSLLEAVLPSLAPLPHVREVNNSASRP